MLTRIIQSLAGKNVPLLSSHCPKIIFSNYGNITFREKACIKRWLYLTPNSRVSHSKIFTCNSNILNNLPVRTISSNKASNNERDMSFEKPPSISLEIPPKLQNPSQDQEMVSKPKLSLMGSIVNRSPSSMQPYLKLMRADRPIGEIISVMFHLQALAVLLT